MYDVVIIGAGPAGMTAGIYAKRFNLNVAIFEYDAPGGAMVRTETINNYPGFNSISGVDLSTKMFNQLMELNVDFISEKVENVKKENGIFLIKAENDYYAKSVIIATGTSDMSLGHKNEKKYFYKGISWCAVCDGPLYKGKEVAVVGGGLSAISSCISLSAYVKKVYLIHRRDEFRGEKKILDKLYSLDNVEIITNSTISDFLGNERLEKIEIKNKDNEKRVLEISCLFECVGKVPNTSLFEDMVNLDDKGYIITNDKMETSVQGIYACGDVIVKDVRQIATATGDGAICAINVNKYLKLVK